MVIVAQPDFKPSKLQSYSWADKHADISVGFQKASFSVSTLIDKAISVALKQKGFQPVPAASAKMLIRYHVSMASEMDDMALVLKYGLAPGVRGNSAEAKAHERGRLIVDLIDPALNKVVWRGAVEVFTGLEDTPQGRQNRVNGLLAELFRGVQAAAK